MHPLNTTLFLVLLFLISACNDNNSPDSLCGPVAVIDSGQFSSATTELLDVMSIDINQDCFELTIGSSGCDGDSWGVSLFDAGVVLESFPVQRNLVISLFNEELCDGYFTRDYTFDISNLQVGESGTVLLNISNTGEQISYEY